MPDQLGLHSEPLSLKTAALPSKNKIIKIKTKAKPTILGFSGTDFLENEGLGDIMMILSESKSHWHGLTNI